MTAYAVGAREPSPAQDTGERGYREFYVRYRRSLKGYVRRCFPDADVEAVVQDTFCRAFAHWTDVGSLEPAWPWLVVTARNLARNNIRDDQRSRATGLKVYDPSSLAGADVATQVEAADQMRLLARAMQVLTPLQRQLVTVMVEEGLTGTQAARRLGMRPGSARMHLCRLRRLLAEHFVALGGQLALIPMALSVMARLRRRVVSAQQVVLAGGASALAASVAVFVVSLGPGGFGPSTGTLSRDLTAPVLRTSAQLAAARGSGQLAPPAVTRPVAQRPVGRVYAERPATPAVVTHLVLSSTPTRPGTSADAGVEVVTPVGTLYVEVPVTLSSPGPGARCVPGVGC